MKIKFLITFLLATNLLLAQSGNYFLSHYAPEDERFDYFTFAMAQDDKGVFHFANRRGVIEFDGRNWGLIPTSGPIFTVTFAGHEIFAGGYGGFGKLTTGPDHVKAYQSLSQEQTDASQIFSSLSINGKIYFANAHSIFVFSVSTGTVESVIRAKQKEEFNGLIEITGKPYVKSTSGIFQIAEKLVPPTFPWQDDLSIELSATSTFAAEPLTILSVSGGRLFLASMSGLKEINLIDKDFLVRNTPVAVAWMSDALVAVGTLRGGVIFIDPRSGVTQEITNYYTGLPDNEVYTMFTDRNDGLWVAHGYGFTRVAPFIPFKSFNHYSGIYGNLLCAKTFGSQTYVGTTLGLFSLTKEEIIEEVHSKAPESNDKKDSKKGGLFSFLRRNKVAPAEAQLRDTRQVVRQMGFAFKKVEGIDGKVNQLIEADNQLLAAGNFGVSQVNGIKSTSIVSQATRSVYKSTTLNQLFVSTLNDNIKTFVSNPKGWQETHLLDTLNEYVSYIFEDKLQNIWLCGRTNAIKVETVDGAITAVEQVPFLNPTIDESVGLAFGSEVYVATGGSFHRYDIKDNVFKKHDSIPSPKKYFASAGYFWFHDGHRWRTVAQSGLKLEWLGLFSNVRYISYADNQNLWVITSNNELFKYSSKEAGQGIKDYPLFLREVRGQHNKFTPGRSIIVSQLESTVAFDFIQPDYLGMRAVEYRYQVKAKNSDWTPWATSNNIVNFSYLPTGTYKLDVQTRDLMGKISAVEEITLEVEPPYWRRSWFYLLEVIFFGAMVYLSIRLGAGNKKYRLISQVLSMLTIIMIIQLVQAAVTTQVSFKTSPVIDFFVQVGLAMLVLPVEIYLRKLMVKGSRLNSSAGVKPSESSITNTDTLSQ